MNTKITRSLLAEANGAVKGLIQKDSSSPFSRVRLDASGTNVSLTASNGDVQVEYRVVGDTLADGTATLPGGLFVRFADAMPLGIVEIGGEPGKKFKMSGEGVTFRVASGEAADYPVMAGPSNDAATFEIESVLLRELLRKVKFAASEDRTRAAICGVNIKLSGEKLSLTATDGRRLAHVETEISRGEAGKPGEIDVTLPNKTVGVLWALLDGESSDILVTADGKSARFVGGKWLMTTKVLEEKYPGWERVVPEKTEHEATIGRDTFLEAMGRAALASGEDNVVKVTVADGQVKFEARSALSSASMAISDCKADGEEMFHFDSRILKDTLESIDDDDFRLLFNGSKTPVVLKCSVPWLAVIMPMCVK